MKKSEIISLISVAVPMGLILCYVRGDFDKYNIPETLQVIIGGLAGFAAFIFFGYLLCKAWDLTFGKLIGNIRSRRRA